MNTRKAWQLGSAPVEGLEFLWDRAVRFGMSVFETLAIHRGRPLFLEEHLLRLAKGSRDLLSVDASPFCEAAQSLPLPDRQSGILRIYVTAGTGGLDEVCASPNAFALFEETEIFSSSPQGLTVQTDRAPVLPVPGGWKTGNYWANLRALQSAKREGFDEAVLINPAGEVISCATGNLFCVLRGRLITPALSSGARDGVIREWVLAQTGAEESLLSIDDLAAAGEVFLTNSRLGIATVSSLDGRQLPPPIHAGPLAAAYREKILHD
ncbi:MAG: aminotransferase class IV [Terrimicrobiaceae bacterium]